MLVNPPRHLRAITIGLLLAAVACSSETKPSYNIPDQPDGLTVLPANASVEAGYVALPLTLQLRQAGAVTYVPPDTATWGTEDATIATVDKSGNLTGLKPGTTNVTVTYALAGGQTFTGKKAVTVTPAVKYLQVSPPVPTVGTADGATPVSTVAIYTDNSTRDVTADSSFSIRPLTVGGTPTATVSGNAVTALSAGSSILDVQYHGRSYSTVVVTKVTTPTTAGTLKSIAISSTPPTTPYAKFQKFKVQATATYSDGSTKSTSDGTLSGATFKSDAASVITFSGNTATAAGPGTANVTVEYVEGSTKVTSAPVAFTIADVNLTSFVITVAGVPATTMNLALDAATDVVGRPVKALGTYDDGKQRDITRTVTWAIAPKDPEDTEVHADLTAGGTVSIGAVTPPANDPAQYTPGTSTVTASYKPTKATQTMDVVTVDTAVTFALSYTDADGNDVAAPVDGGFVAVTANWAATGDSNDVTTRCNFVSTNPGYAQVDTLSGSASFAEIQDVPGGTGPANIDVYFIPTEDSPTNAVTFSGWKTFVPTKVTQFAAP